jgi:hypothetical protein
MALKSVFWKTLGTIVADEQAQEAERYKAQQAQARKAETQAIMAATDKRAADEEDAKRTEELRPKRDEAHMPLLASLITKYEQQLKSAKAILEPALPQLQEELATMQAADKTLSVSYGDLTKREKLIALIKAKPQVILHAAKDFDAETQQAVAEAGLSLSEKTSKECMFPHDVEKKLKAILAPATFTIILDHYNDGKNISTLKVKLAEIGESDKKAQRLVFSDTENPHFSYDKKLTTAALSDAVATVVRWQVRSAPHSVASLEQQFKAKQVKLEKAEARAAEVAWHNRLYGHTNFLVNEGDSTDVMKSKLQAHFAASMPRLREAAGRWYDMLPRPDNKDYLKTVANDVKALNGEKLENGQTLKVTYDRHDKESHTLTIETVSPDKTFTNIPERLELRWSGVADRFDALITNAQGVTNIVGPQEYRHDMQYQFLNAQIGQWLSTVDANAAQRFVESKESRSIYIEPQKYSVAGYKRPQLKK